MDLDLIVGSGEGDGRSRGIRIGCSEGNDGFGCRVFNLLLDQTAKIARTVDGGIAFLHEKSGHIFSPGEGDIAGSKSILQLAQHEDGNGSEILFSQLIEADDFVHAIHELGTEELAEGLHAAVFGKVTEGAAEADAAGFGAAAGIGGHDDDGIFKVDSAALSIGDTAIIKNLEKDMWFIFRVKLMEMKELKI